MSDLDNMCGLANFDVLDSQQDDSRELMLRIDAALGQTSTPEQKELIMDNDNDIISTSFPGTGKTQTIVKKLVMLVKGNIVPEDKITALSFTNAATAELKYRYMDAAAKLGKIRCKINFQTIHAMCSSLIREHYDLLGFEDYKKPDPLPYNEIMKFLINYGAEAGIPITKSNVRQVKRALDDMNSSLIFDPKHIAVRQTFKECKLTISDFTKVRHELYTLNRALGTVQEGDLLLYALELLLENPKVVQEQKQKRLVTICDECQDLSVLQLKLLDLISTKLIIVGDIHQQIFGFAGASPKIMQEFFKLRPNAVHHDLTYSFRCGSDIVEAAKKVMRPNGSSVEAFKCLEGRESNVDYIPRLNAGEICDNIRQDLDEHEGKFSRSSLFLYRDNFSVLPIFEELYKRGIPMQSDRFKKAYEVDIVKDLIDLIRVANDPSDISNFYIFKKLLPEFQPYKKLKDIPLAQVVELTGCSVLEVDYEFKDEYAGSQLMTALTEAREMLNNNESVYNICQSLWPVYDEIYYQENYYKYAQDAEYYMGLVAPILMNKTFQEFLDTEIAKEREIEKWNDLRMGVRCYTMHASKGTEADDVYILDASEGVIPNEKRLSRTVKLGCLTDAALAVRNERSLMFVAITRAKYNVKIGYTGKVAPIAIGVNTYNHLDRAFEQSDINYNDVEYFRHFYKGEI